MPLQPVDRLGHRFYGNEFAFGRWPDTSLLRPRLELSTADGGNENTFEPETRSLADPEIETRDSPQLSTESDLADRCGIRRQREILSTRNDGQCYCEIRRWLGHADAAGRLCVDVL